MERSNNLLHCFFSKETKHSTYLYPLGSKCNNVRSYIKTARQYKLPKIEIIHKIGQINPKWNSIDLNGLTASITVVCYTIIQMELLAHQLF